MAQLETLKDALVDELKDLYSAENQLLKALPKMEKKASSPELKEAIKAHLKETEGHVERLEEMGSTLGVKLTGKVCKAMQGLIEEGKEALEEESDNEALIDALIIGAARRVEHYEMAAYCTARAMATEYGDDTVADLLDETFTEESAADDKLKEILVSTVLPEANQGEADEDEDVPPRIAAKKNDPKKLGKNLGKTMAFLAIFAAGSLTSAKADTGAKAMMDEREAKIHAPDNTGRNERDKNDARMTASDQPMSGDQNQVLAQIRKDIVANNDLSVNGKNVKIMVENGVVTLRGPVKSLGEKEWIEKTTAKAAQGYKIVDQIEIARQ